MGLGMYLLLITWGMGIMCTIGSFIVQPRSQAPAFLAFGFVFLVVAINWTRYKKAAPIREAEAERKKKLEEQTKREQQETQLAHLEGLAKYHQMDVTDAQKYQEGIQAMRQLGFIMQQSVYQEKEKDWAILGGIADGIGGPVAGIATAANAIQDNVRINAENAARRKWAAKQNAFYQNLACEAERKSPTALSMSELQKKYKAIISWAPSTLHSLIKLSEIKIDVDELTGAVTVSASWQQDDKSICIDGSFRAKIYTDSGDCTGCAYLVLPKEGTVKFSGVLSGICACPIPSNNYSVVIEPANLWELAAKKNSTDRATDNLTYTEHRKIVEDSEANFQNELKSAKTTYEATINLEAQSLEREKEGKEGKAGKTTVKIFALIINTIITIFMLRADISAIQDIISAPSAKNGIAAVFMVLATIVSAPGFAKLVFRGNYGMKQRLIKWGIFGGIIILDLLVMYLIF